MGFLTATYESLGSSIYTEDGLRGAQDVWRTAIQRYDPGWIDNSQGVVGRLFQSDGGPAANELIELAWMLRELSAKLTVNSEPKFPRKVRQLLRETDEKHYRELKAELGVGALLTEYVSPIAFEPYDSPDTERHDAVTSPDYAIRLPDGVVAIEVTVLYVEAIERWERLVSTARESLMQRIGKAGANKEIELNVPLEVGRLPAGDFAGRVAAAIRDEPSGRLQIAVGGGMAEVAWRPMAVMEASDPTSTEWPDNETFSGVMTSGSGGFGVAGAAGAKVAPIIDDKRFQELVYRALRNTLRGKRKQFGDKQEPYLLVIQPGHRRIPPALVEATFTERVWPNEMFEWVTGVGLYLPRQAYEMGSPDRQLIVAFNPWASRPASPCLRALVEEGYRFHKPVPPTGSDARPN